jgi:hypothetical protein
MQEVSTAVAQADTLQGRALKHTFDDKPMLRDNVNPNTNRFGNMWRNAFSRIEQAIRDHRQIRLNWEMYVYVCKHKTRVICVFFNSPLLLIFNSTPLFLYDVVMHEYALLWWYHACAAS